MSGNGFGAESGYNSRGEEESFVTGLLPEPNGMLPSDRFVRFSVGAVGAPPDASTLRVTAGGLVAYDGSTGTFSSVFSTSTVSAASDGSIAFAVKRTGSYPGRVATFLVEGSSTYGIPILFSWVVTVQSLTAYPPMPSGLELGRVPIQRLSGEVQTGILGGAAGLVFASPALVAPNSGSQVDVDKAEITSHAGDWYVLDPGTNPRPFLWGPPPSIPSGRVFPPDFSPPDYEPVWGDPGYAFMRTTPHAVGRMSATKAISGTSNSAGLILVTTSSPHGYSTGDSVTVEHVNGTVEANGTWTVTVTGASTFTLDGSSFVNPFAASTPPGVAHSFRSGTDVAVILY